MGRTKTGPNGERLSDDASREQTRNALLEAGAHLLAHERRGRFAEARLRVADVVSEAQLSSGAFYDHFKSLDNYMRELLKHLLSPDRYAVEFADIRSAFSQTKGSNVQRFAAMADTDLETLLANPYWTTQASYALAVEPHSEASSFLRHQYTMCDDQTVNAYFPALEAIGLETTPEVSPEVVAQLLQALVEGIALRAKVDPSVAQKDSGCKGLSLYALGAAAIVSALTQPVSASSAKGPRRTFLSELRARWNNNG
ncbi:MAG: TetR/AcrR family transcriptional regulator [Myxococcales bacterium]|nr:TetR/AcrR family transcriptional regulator [Myxococcales bacterium]